MDVAKGLATFAATVPLVSMTHEAHADDDDLLSRAQAGDRTAREELARRWRQPAYLLALQLLRDADDALDVAQESMLRFFDRLGHLAPSADVRPWLFTIVRNQVKDLWRRRRVRRAQSIDDERTGLAHRLVDRGVDPEQEAHRNEVRRQVWTAIECLSEHHREILVLRDFHELSYNEIAGVLAIKPGTVMSRLHSARKRLRAEVERLRERREAQGPTRPAENDHA